LEVGTIDDLKRLLIEKGYSPNAVSEILKWYRENSSNRKA
jgi:predicted Ser/Thr protein kinase